MPIERYFLDENFEKGFSYLLKGTEFHHFAHVMRASINSEVELINGRGLLAKALVLELKKEQAKLQILDIHSEQPTSPRLILAQAMPKPNRLDYILEKGTELGVDAFWLFPGQLSVKKELFPNQIERGRSLIITAAKQCGRLFIPQLIIKPPLLKWVDLETNLTFFGDVRENASIFAKELLQSKNQLFITGPESGLTDKETEHLQKLGANGVKLHLNILRTDTASIMALSLMSYWRMS